MNRKTFILALSLVLVGCTIDSPFSYDPDLRLLFQPGMYAHVSEEDVEAYPEDQDFAVSAWSGSRSLFEKKQAYSQEVTITDSIKQVQVKETLWSFEEQMTWPGKGESVTFAAYSPYEEECEISSDKGVQWSTDILEEQIDLLYAHTQVDRNNNIDGNVVNLCFNHALCQVEFRVKNRVDNEGYTDALQRPDKITVNKITVDGVKHRGDFSSLPSAQWTLQEGKAPLPIYEGTFITGGVPEPIGTVWLMIPQTFDTTITVEFQYTTFANTTITQVIKTVPMKTALVPGRKYTYTLSVGIDDVKFLQEIIEERLVR